MKHGPCRSATPIGALGQLLQKGPTRPMGGAPCAGTSAKITFNCVGFKEILARLKTIHIGKVNATA